MRTGSIKSTESDQEHLRLPEELAEAWGALSKAHQVFVKGILTGRRKAEAYREAFPDASMGTSYSGAHWLLKHESVAAFLREWRRWQLRVHAFDLEQILLRCFRVLEVTPDDIIDESTGLLRQENADLIEEFTHHYEDGRLVRTTYKLPRTTEIMKVAVTLGMNLNLGEREADPISVIRNAITPANGLPKKG